jgi:glycosyltransferase involved in cell wall biosynthesis
MTAAGRGRSPRVLYVQRPLGGGSTTGLVDLLRSLTDSRVVPTVLFFGENRYAPLVHDLGIEVLNLGVASRPVPAASLPRAAPFDETRIEQMARGQDPTDRTRLSRELRTLLRRDVPISRKICRLLKTREFDLVHSNDNPRGDRSILLAAQLSNVPVISHVRFSHVFDQHVDSVLSRGVTRYIYMSEAIRERFESTVGRHVTGTVLYDPLTIPPRAEIDEQARQFRRTEGLEGVQLIVNVARVVPWKGLHVFLEAMAMVLRSNPNAVGLVVGDPADDSSYAEYLRTLSASLGLGDRVRFVGFRSDALTIMGAADVVVHSAIKPEPFGRVIIEAMALGKPVIAAAAGGPLESVVSGVDGILVPPGQPDLLARALEDLLANPERAAAMGRAGVEKVRDRHSEGRFASSLLDIYNEVLDSRLPGTT